MRRRRKGGAKIKKGGKRPHQEKEKMSCTSDRSAPRRSTEKCESPPRGRQEDQKIDQQPEQAKCRFRQRSHSDQHLHASRPATVVIALARPPACRQCST